MKTLTATICVIIALYSCQSSSLKGKIEDRNGTAYLINTSKDRPYQFTVKSTGTLKDSILGYEIEKVVLSPGEEKEMGKLVNPIEPDFVPRQEFVLDTERFRVPIDEIETFKQAFPAAVRVSEKLVDSIGKPVVKKSVHTKYEVTGQLELKNSDIHVGRNK